MNERSHRPDPSYNAPAVGRAEQFAAIAEHLADAEEDLASYTIAAGNQPGVNELRAALYSLHSAVGKLAEVVV